MTGEMSIKRLLLIGAALALSCAGLVLAALAGADADQTVRKGAYGPNTCDNQSQIIDTKITDGPKKHTSKSSAKFAFEAFYCNFPEDNVDQSIFEFECKLDKEKSKQCSSPQKYRGLKRGKHSFQVEARFSDSPSGGDPTPDKYKWEIEN
jgi:hypothetical protein